MTVSYTKFESNTDKPGSSGLGLRSEFRLVTFGSTETTSTVPTTLQRIVGMRYARLNSDATNIEVLSLNETAAIPVVPGTAGQVTVGREAAKGSVQAGRVFIVELIGMG